MVEVEVEVGITHSLGSAPTVQRVVAVGETISRLVGRPSTEAKVLAVVYRGEGRLIARLEVVAVARAALDRMQCPIHLSEGMAELGSNQIFLDLCCVMAVAVVVEPETSTVVRVVALAALVVVVMVQPLATRAVGPTDSVAEAVVAVPTVSEAMADRVSLLSGMQVLQLVLAESQEPVQQPALPSIHSQLSGVRRLI
jgi:hypothetical protein